MWKEHESVSVSASHTCGQMYDHDSIRRHFYTTATTVAVMSITFIEGVAKFLSLLQRGCKLVQLVVVEFTYKGQAQIYL
jgi:hypothetical protein